MITLTLHSAQVSFYRAKGPYLSEKVFHNNRHSDDFWSGIIALTHPPAAPLTALLLLKIVQYDFQAPLDPYKVIKNTETVKK